MKKHATNRGGQKLAASARHAQAGFLQGSIISTLLPGTSIHSQTGVGFTGRKTTSYAIQFGLASRGGCGTRMPIQGLSNQKQRAL
jgi:hypothetical protein